MVKDLDARCSEACTRAGAFGLLLGAIGISLLTPLDAGNTRIALQNYISLRLALKEEVDQISADPCLQKLSAQLGGGNVTKDLTLTELGMYQCTGTSPANESDTEPTISVQAVTTPREWLRLTWEPGQPPEEKGLPPNPPIIVRMIHDYPLPHLNSIIRILTELGDQAMLDAARRYSPKTKNSINLWIMSGHRMLKEIVTKQGVMVIKRSTTAPGFPSGSDVFALRLANVEELSNFALPDAVAYENLRLTEPTIQTPGIPLQIQLEAGSVLLEIAILLTVIYFWIFYGEARLSNRYPEPGTLFSAFHRTRASHAIFNTLIAVPGVCSVILAIWLTWYSFSRYMTLILIPALLTIWFTLAILKSSLPISTEPIYDLMGHVFRRPKLLSSGFYRRKNRTKPDDL